MQPADSRAPVAVVLDTNVVLDWLLFNDRGVSALAAALRSGRLRWLACARMRDEFERTLRRPELARWHPHGLRLLARFDNHAAMLAAPVSTPVLRCDDADDQVFVDLALENQARWLISHDRAVLRLRRRAAALGLLIAKPAHWLPS